MSGNLSLKDKIFSKKKHISLGLVVLFLAVFSAIHLNLISDTFHIDKKGSIHSTPAGYGDVPLHLTQISKFAFQSDFNLDEPIFYGNKLKYHFGLNMFRGWLLALTNKWSFSVLWPLYALALLNVSLIFLIYRKFVKNSWLALLSLFLFFFGAGIAGWGSLLGKPVRRLIDFSFLFNGQNTDFGPVLSMAFTHQHTFFLGTFGFSLFLLLLLKIKEIPRPFYVGTAGMVLGILPLMHVHSFVVACLTSGIVALTCLYKKEYADFKRFLLVIGLGALISLPQILFLRASTGFSVPDVSFPSFRLGWMTGVGYGSVVFPTADRSIFSWSFLEFIWVNFGILIPVFVFLVVFFIYRYHLIHTTQRKIMALLAIGASSIFMMVQTIQFQAWDFDNNKILVYSLFFAAPFIVWSLWNLFYISRFWQVFTLTVVLFFSTFSGVVDTIYYMRLSERELPVIFDLDAQKMAEYIRNNIKEQDFILTTTDSHNPVSSLAGRQILMGYGGWLWTRGIDYTKRMDSLKKFYQSPMQNKIFLDTWRVSYMLFDPTAAHEYKAEKTDFEVLFPKQFEAGRFTLFRVEM